MAATGNEAVKLSQLKSLNDKTVADYTAAVAAEASERQKQDGLIQADVDAKLQADDLVAGTNVTLDTQSQAGKVVISATGGGEQYITSVEPVNMKVTDGELSFTDGSEFFQPYGGGMFRYRLSPQCLPVRTMANGDEQIACIVLDETAFMAVNGTPTYQEHPILKLNGVLLVSELHDYYVSGTDTNKVKSESPLTARSTRAFVMLPSKQPNDYVADYGLSGQVLSSNGDRTFSWKTLDTSGSAVDPGSVGTTELADGSVTTAKIADDAVTSEKIALHAVDTMQLAIGSVTGDILAEYSVTANKIPNRAITEFKLAADCVTENNMANSAVTNAKLAVDSVGNINLMTGCVTSEKIADEAVNMEDLNMEVRNRLVPTGGSSSTFLRGDGSWATPANTTYTAGDGLKLMGTEFSVDFVSDTDFDSYFGL